MVLAVDVTKMRNREWGMELVSGKITHGDQSYVGLHRRSPAVAWVSKSIDVLAHDRGFWKFLPFK